MCHITEKGWFDTISMEMTIRMCYTNLSVWAETALLLENQKLFLIKSEELCNKYGGRGERIRMIYEIFEFFKCIILCGDPFALGRDKPTLVKLKDRKRLTNN
ncbi:hypothetical protein M0813_06786 [Anaeramoeba flamelloides]|uniref:Uncharacterized protein n=1 Tax=Anaeramoeba flamelloides TaxID=1746091 RepID=A0ABQ8XD69_9EUKA|nr:hypothetical protein M0813_06786 [Anaeramoeba flamelloides]